VPVIYDKCRRKLGKPGLGSDEWSEEDVVAHAVIGDRTVCGVTVGSERRGWFRNFHATSAVHVTCRRCKGGLAAAAKRRKAEREE
jgi:hypothetical protein